MKLICYILLILLIPTIPVGAQTLSGGQVQVSNQSILISDNGQVMIGMDITLPTAMELSSNLSLIHIYMCTARQIICLAVHIYPVYLSIPQG